AILQQLLSTLQRTKLLSVLVRLAKPRCAILKNALLLSHTIKPQLQGDEKWITHNPPKHALIHRASVRDPPMMIIAAYTVGTRPGAMRRTVAAVILSAFDLARTTFAKHYRLTRIRN
ncbi:MAG TPA: hypothetical protein VFS90_22450, partial [Pyrinomonadaceae bacterium]|nr:hypothetical protein [Pyrinomonadaceae bacterium]